MVTCPICGCSAPVYADRFLSHRNPQGFDCPAAGRLIADVKAKKNG